MRKIQLRIFNKFIGQSQYQFSALLKERLRELIPEKQAELQNIKKKYGNTVIDQYTLDQVIGGMRGIKGLFQDISRVDPYAGVMFKGYTIPQLKEFLQKAKSDGEPLPEACFWLLMTGKVPTDQEYQDVRQDWLTRGHLDEATKKFILNLPLTMHSMTMLSMTLLFLQQKSTFSKLYSSGKLNKKNYWEPFFDDSMELIAKIPRVAAVIYRHKYHNSELISCNDNLDWAANYAHMMGFDNEVMKECIRGYLTIHSDHEGGNVSAHTCHLVGSALSDPFLSYSAALNGLAGPLHGLANQETLNWVFDLVKKFDGNMDSITREMIEKYVDDSVTRGKVVPGYGHAVLREVDPRFTHQYEFSQKYLSDNSLIKLLHRCADTIPTALKKYPKIKNPFPNVDAHSGVLLHSLGLQQNDYYTVVFAVSRALGCMTNLIWARIYGLPIERPGSIDISWIKKKTKQM